jgi:hypothetical protein
MRPWTNRVRRGSPEHLSPARVALAQQFDLVYWILNLSAVLNVPAPAPFTPRSFQVR